MAPRIVDLSLTLRRGMRGVDWETACTFERDGWNSRNLHLYSHAGTHMDAPVHFAAGPGPSTKSRSTFSWDRPGWSIFREWPPGP